MIFLPDISGKPGFRCFIWTLLLPILICGCAVPYQVKISQNGSPKYKNIDIQYHTHSSREAFKSEESKKVQLIDYSAEPTVKQDSKEWTKSSLKIQYPHPEGKDGIALATLTMSQASFKALHQYKQKENENSGNPQQNQIVKQSPGVSKTPQINEEIWKYEFPKEQLDLFLSDISKSGFFDEQTRPSGEAHLSIQIDKGSRSKKWTQDPRLEDFIKRIYEKGWLDCYYTGSCK